MEVYIMDESLVLSVIAEQLGVPAENLSPETAFADLNADSLELFQIIMALEEKFEILIVIFWKIHRIIF